MCHRLIFRIVPSESVYYPTIIYAFGNLPDDDQILDLLVDIHCYKGSIAAISMDLDNGLPRSFMFRAMRTFAERRDSGKKEQYPQGCDHHNHTTEEERRNCRAQVQKQLSE